MGGGLLGTFDSECEKMSTEGSRPEQLNTHLVEVEGIINSRPLTYVKDDTGGTSYTLSPSHLVYGRRITGAPNDLHFEVVSTNDTLTNNRSIY